MGAPMAQRLQAAGHEVTVVTRQKRDDARFATTSSIPVAVQESDAVFCCLPGPNEVRSVLLDDGGVLAHAQAGTLVVDMSTSSPSLATTIAELASARSVISLDAPVTGGPAGATDGTLSIMVGGDRIGFERAHPLLAVLGKSVTYQGGAGAGHRVKLANQVMVASTMIAIAEVWALLRSRDPRPEHPLEAMQNGIAGSPLLGWVWGKLEGEDRLPGFKVDHLIKDLDLVLSEAERMDLDLAQVRLARERYMLLTGSGGGELGTQTVVEVHPESRPVDP